MRKPVLLAQVVLLSALTFVSFAANDVGKCPISGKPAKESSFLNVNGEKVYFCCDKCPKAYEKKLNVVDKGPDKCPISGKAASADQRMLHKSSEMVYFCCEKCVKAYAKQNNIELAGLEESKPGKCPITGKDAKDDSFLVVNGEKVYFCCDKCPKAYVKKEGVKDEGAKKCPLDSEDADADQKMIVTKAQAVYFCCEKCPKEYAKKNLAKAESK